MGAAATTGSSSCSAASRRPGSASGIGLDRVVLALESSGVAAAPEPHPVAVVVGADPDATVDRLRIATQLREAGLAARAELGRRKLGKQLEAAAKEHAHFAVILGDELGDGQVQVKDLEAGTQRLVGLADLSRELARAHGAHRHGPGETEAAALLAEEQEQREDRDGDAFQRHDPGHEVHASLHARQRCARCRQLLLDPVDVLGPDAASRRSWGRSGWGPRRRRGPSARAGGRCAGRPAGGPPRARHATARPPAAPRGSALPAGCPFPRRRSSARGSGSWSSRPGLAFAPRYTVPTTQSGRDPGWTKRRRFGQQ